MKTEITIRRKTIWLLFFAVLLIFSGFVLKGTFQREKPQPAEMIISNEDLVKQGTYAFFSIDYSAGYETWLESFCASSSASGCEIVQNIFGPALWKFVEEHQFSTTCSVEVKEVVESDDDFEVWKTIVTFSPPFPDQSSTQTIYSMTTLQPDATWAFERVLTDHESESYE